MKQSQWTLRKRAAYLEGWVSVVVNTLLFVVKYYVGTLFNSIAVVADAFHTLSDSLTSVVLILGYKLADKPPDREHPFGHGRAELLGGLTIGVLLSVVAYEFFLESYRKLVSLQTFEYSELLLLVLLVSTLVKAALGLWAYKLGKRHESQPIIGDAWHHNSDAAASGLLAVAMYLGRAYWWVDGVLGLAVSALILFTAIEVTRSASSELLGRAPTRAELAKLTEVVRRAHPLVSKVHHVHFHRYGNHVEVTLHVKLPGNVTLKEAHDIATLIENAIREELGYEATVHVEPGERVENHVD